MKIKNRKLFFAYALPCIENLVEKGKISKGKAKKLLSDYERGKELPAETEKIFKIALFYLEKIAKEMGKNTIDEKVIRRYFQRYHNKIVEKDKGPEACKVKFGKILKVQGRYVLVEVDGKIKNYKTFVKDLKENEEIVLHWDYIVDRPTIKVLVFGNPLVKEDSITLRLMNKLKEELPEIEFKEFDTAESLENEGKDIIILDFIKGLKKVEIIKDLEKIERRKVFSPHDFDLSYELKLLKKLKLIESFRIIGIPSSLREKEILKQVKKILSNPSYF